MLTTSVAGRLLIEAFEGCEKLVAGTECYVPYYDSVGVLTVGYGHTNLGNVPPVVIAETALTKAECDLALSNDLARFEGYVNALGFSLSQNQFDALVSFDFNTGDLARSSIPEKIRNGDTYAAMATLLLYCHAGGIKLPGLVRRRQAERLMFLGEIDAALTLADAHTATANPQMAKAAVEAPATVA